MNIPGFPNTAFGKSLQVLVYVAISGAVSALLAFFSENPDFFSPQVVGIINVALVAIKNVINPSVKNV